MDRMNIDDGDMWICEFEDHAIASMQSSYVTVGNYPGIEARFYGSEGAVIVRLVEEFGSAETIKTARKDAVEFVERDDPRALLPDRRRRARRSGRSLFYPISVRDFTDEILEGAGAIRVTSPRARLYSGPSSLRDVRPPAPLGRLRRGGGCLISDRSQGRRRETS